MKKVLFATTALVALAGAAAADVTLGGSANAGLRNTGAGDTFLHYEIDFDIIASGSTDNGLTFGASIDLDLENNNNSSEVDDPEIFVSGAFGTLTIGALDPMLDNIGLRDPGFDGIGIDDVVEGLRFAPNGSAANVTYMYEAAGFTFGLSTFIAETNGGSANEGDYGILIGYEMDGLSASVAYDRDDSANSQQWGLNLGYAMDAYAVNLMYTDGDNGDGFGLDASYTIDALTIIGAYATDNVSNTDAFGIGASYALGGGLTLAGGVGEIDGTGTVWDLGLTMSF
jgi:outer membrane protein OmpU